MTGALRRVPWWAWPLLVGVVVVAGAGLAWALQPAEDPPPGYDADTRAAFLDACTADGGDDVAPVCACWYDAIVETIPYGRYDEVNRALLAERLPTGAEIEVPDDFAELLEACRTDPAA